MRSGTCVLCCPSARRTRSACPTCTPWRPSAPTSGRRSSSRVSPHLPVPAPALFGDLCAFLPSCSSPHQNFPLSGLVSGGRAHSSLPYPAFLQALHGFILVTTAQGKLVYVSENVSDYLGFSVVSRQNGHGVGVEGVKIQSPEFKVKRVIFFR